MVQTDKTSARDYRDFRFRLRHDNLLRQRLKRAKQEATIKLAEELGFHITLDDLEKRKRSNTRR